MKQNKFIIAVLMVMFAIQGALAVTLPTTSYQSYDPSYDESVGPSGLMIKGSYLAQGTGDYSNCAGDGSGEVSGGGMECSVCCSTKYSRDDYDECINFCWSGQPPLTPISGGLWFLILLPILAIMLRLLLWHMECQRRIK